MTFSATARKVIELVLDTSAIVAVQLREPGYERILERIEAADIVVAGTPAVFEAAMVLTSRFGYDARPILFAFLRRIEAEIVEFHEGHLDAAITAFMRFGRGRHPAAMNFGDCMAYAIAADNGLPLLFKGEDFARTDITPA